MSRLLRAFISSRLIKAEKALSTGCWHNCCWYNCEYAPIHTHLIFFMEGLATSGMNGDFTLCIGIRVVINKLYYMIWYNMAQGNNKKPNCFLTIRTPYSVQAWCFVMKCSVTDTEEVQLLDRLWSVEGLSLYILLPRAETEVGFSPANPSGWKEVRFDECVMCTSRTDKLTLMVGVTLPGRDLLSRSLRVLLSPATGGWSCSWCLSS